VSPQVVAFEITADGAMHNVSASHTGNLSCGDNRNFSLPASCNPIPCEGSYLGGTVFSDNNADGNKDSGENVGLGEVTVSAISADGQTFTTTTDFDGSYLMFIPEDKYPVRVEFSDLNQLVGDGTPAGSSGKSTVQFVDSPTCDVDLGIVFGEDFCDTNPLVMVPCYVTGDPSNSNVGPLDALIAYNYSLTGLKDPSQMITMARFDEVGATWGMAHNRYTEKAYSAAFLKRHVAFGPLGIGGIYETDISDLNNVSTAPFLDVESDLGIDVGGSIVDSDADRGLLGGAGLTTPSREM